jgi:hypothetical protein
MFLRFHGKYNIISIFFLFHFFHVDFSCEVGPRLGESICKDRKHILVTFIQAYDLSTTVTYSSRWAAEARNCHNASLQFRCFLALLPWE